MSSRPKKGNLKDGIVNIKKEAFKRMITHVLRFGNEALKTSVEVLGVCIGKIAINGKDIDLINAQPITHGSRGSMEFSTEDYTMFTKIEEHYASQKLNTVGWYYSNPEGGLIFSDVAIKNHRFFQKKENPYGFCIVFDHTLMGKEGNMGFSIYRLNDFKNEKSREYHKVEYELELPNTLEYFKWVQRFVEDSQKKAPILIKEINELTKSVPEDLQEIPKPEDFVPEGLKEDEYPNISQIISGFQEGTLKFSEIFMDTFKSQLGNWAKDVSEGSIEGTELLRNSLNQMNNKISLGMSKIENWFRQNLDTLVDSFKNNISNYVDNQIEAQKQLINNISKSKDDIVENIKNMTDSNFETIFKEIEAKTKDISEEINKNEQTNAKIEDLINTSSEKISTLANETTNLSKDIEESISTTSSAFKQKIMGDMEKLNVEINNIKETHSQMIDTFKKLQKFVDSLKET